MIYESARELFDAAREAALDAERCRRQLEDIERRALSVGSPSFGPLVSGSDHDRLTREVAAMVDRERELEGRIEDDYRLIDAACAVLYGRDGMSDGLASIAPPWWADAIYQHYLALHTWSVVAVMMCYSAPHVRKAVQAAFELMDSMGMVATVDGRGSAEG